MGSARPGETGSFAEYACEGGKAVGRLGERTDRHQWPFRVARYEVTDGADEIRSARGDQNNEIGIL